MLGSKEAEPTITFAMLDEKMDMPFVREHFKSLGLDVFDAWSFFKLLDADASGQAPRTRGFQWISSSKRGFSMIFTGFGEAFESYKIVMPQVGAEEFLMGCLRLRGPATAIDMGRLLKESPDPMPWTFEN